jgi:hypothetical protein
VSVMARRVLLGLAVSLALSLLVSALVSRRDAGLAPEYPWRAVAAAGTPPPGTRSSSTPRRDRLATRSSGRQCHAEKVFTASLGVHQPHNLLARGPQGYSISYLGLPRALSSAYLVPPPTG